MMSQEASWPASCTSAFTPLLSPTVLVYLGGEAWGLGQAAGCWEM